MGITGQRSSFRPVGHPNSDVTKCPKCADGPVSLPAYSGDYFDCEACGHSWKPTDAQHDSMLSPERRLARRLARALPTLTQATPEKHASVAARIVRDMGGAL